MSKKGWQGYVIEYATHISQNSVWDAHREGKVPKREPHGCPKREPHGCCKCKQPGDVSPVGECSRCHRLVRPGALATLDQYGRGRLVSAEAS